MRTRSGNAVRACLVASTVAALLVGCPRTGKEWVEQQGAVLEISLLREGSVFRRGEPIDLLVSLCNHGDSSVAVRPQMFPQNKFLSLELRDSAERPVPYRGPMYRVPARPRAKLVPGRCIRELVHLDELFGLDSGQYSVTARYGDSVFGEPAGISLTSNALAFEVGSNPDTDRTDGRLSPDQPRLAVRLLSAENSFRCGDPIDLLVSLCNGGVGPIEIPRWIGPSDHCLALRVEDSEGNPLPFLGDKLKCGAEARRTLAPGACVNNLVHLDAVYEFTLDIYKVRADYWDNPQGPEVSRIKLQSEPILVDMGGVRDRFGRCAGFYPK